MEVVELLDTNMTPHDMLGFIPFVDYIVLGLQDVVASNPGRKWRPGFEAKDVVALQRLIVKSL